MNGARRVCALLFLAAGLAPAALAGAPVAADHGMVASAHPIATRVGVEVLRGGGNAVDAAVAVGYALAVVYPAAGNLGGGGFMTLRLADGRSTFLDFRETAPLAATERMYLDEGGNPIPGASTRGHLAAAVPGSVAGLELARERYGSMPRAALIEPAFRLARWGFVLGQGDTELLGPATEDLAADPAAAAIFTNGGRRLQAGERLVQRGLALTLWLIARDGPAAFYRGPVAAEIARASRAHGGLLSEADLAAYRVRELTPVSCRYRGYDISSAPPPSSGGTTLCLVLNVLEGYPLGDWGFQSTPALHHLAEALRRAFVERNAWLGDPAFVDNPVERLLADEHASAVRASIRGDRATPSSGLRAGEPPGGSIQTTHYSIVDRAGNAVSVTTTLNGAFGARVVAGRTGILLNNEMDDFTASPGIPNLYGLVQGRANAIAPGKRPLSSMTPTVVSRDGRPLLVIGSPGGPRIISTVLQVILNLVDHGMTVAEAIAAPRVHHQWLPDVLFVEPGAGSERVREELEAMGHAIEESRPWGEAAGILVGGAALGPQLPAAAPRYYGASDPRSPLATAAGL
jgi:gamma-glutamyltranspeptidase/glutathione hydrolase